MRITLIAVAILSVVTMNSSCKSAIIVNTEMIKFEWPKQEPFELSKIEVIEFNGKGIPLSYIREVTYICKPVANEFRPESKISLTDSLTNYLWKTSDSTVSTGKLPLEMQVGGWYEISNYLDYSDSDKLIFRMLSNKNNKARIYYIRDSGL